MGKTGVEKAQDKFAPAGKTLDSCLFCNPQVIQQGLLGETDHFYLCASMQGAVAPGHVMIISKEHYSCFGAMPPELDSESRNTLSRIREKIETHFGKVYLLEQGIHGQSIHHAHTHFIPLISSWYDFSPEPIKHKKMLPDYIPFGIPVSGGKSIADIRRIFRDDGQYVSMEERGQLYICHTKNYSGNLHLGRSAPCQQSGRTELSNWRTMPESAKRENEKWIEETLQKLAGGF